MADRPLLICRNLSFSFGSEKVIRNLTFEAKQGTHTVLKGESGSGKSTILKLVLGFLKPSSGRIVFQHPEDDLKNIRQQTAWLPQDLNLGDGTTEEVIQKPFSFGANHSQFLRDEILNTLEVLGISANNMEKQFSDLSTGQRQRVGLAICHFLDKPLLLLDEPTSALDHASKQKVADLLITADQTVISTSHDPFWVDLAENVIELS